MSTLLIRHGETEWNDVGRIQGWAPVTLSATGREQAARVGASIAAEYDVDAVVSSDLHRTHETAAAIAEATGTDIETDERLRERNFGVYQGLSSATFFERFPAFDLLESGETAVTKTPEGGESWRAVRERVLAAGRELTDRPGTVAVVTHVNPIRLLIGDCRGLDVPTALTELAVDNCAVTELAGREVVRENDTSMR